MARRVGRACEAPVRRTHDESIAVGSGHAGKGDLGWSALKPNDRLRGKRSSGTTVHSVSDCRIFSGRFEMNVGPIRVEGVHGLLGVRSVISCRAERADDHLFPVVLGGRDDIDPAHLLVVGSEEGAGDVVPEE